MSQRAISLDPKSVLVVKIEGLAEFVLSLAAMKRIRQAYPLAKITLRTSPPFAGLAKASGYFDQVEALSIAEPLTLSGTARSKFDQVFDFDSNSALDGLKRWALSFKPLRSLIPHAHLLERQAAQLRAAGVWPDAPTTPGAAPPPDMSWIARKAAEQRPVSEGSRQAPYIMLAPGGREASRWPIQQFGQVAERFRAAGYDIIVVGQPEDSALARLIQRSDPRARDLTGHVDFATIAALGYKAALAIGNDAGHMHLIAASGAPTLAIFSSQADLALTGPRGHVAILQADDLSQLTLEEVLRAAANLAPGAVG